MGMNVTSGESRKAISGLYRMCQLTLDREALVKHDHKKIPSLQEDAVPTEAEGPPPQKFRKVEGVSMRTALK